MGVKPGYKQTDLGVFPEEWTIEPLGRHAAFRTGPFGSALHKSDYISDGVPVVNPMHIVDGKIEPTRTMTITEDAARKLSDFRLKAGEVVIGRRGDMGRCAVVQREHAGWLCGTGSMIIRPKSADPAFLQRVLSSPRAIAAIEDASVGTTMVNLNQGTLSRLAIQFPPLPEQRAIAAALSDVDALLGGLDRLIAKKRDLKQAAMQQLLTGQTRLPGFSSKWEVKRFGSVVDHVFPKSTLSSGDGLGRGAFPLFVSGGEPKRTEVAQFRDSEALVFSDGGVFGVRRAVGSFSVTDHCYMLTLNPETADMRWFEAWFSLHAQQMDRLTFKGSGLRNLDKPSLRDIEISTPERDEQTAIAAVLSDMDAEQAALEARRDKTYDLKLAMMQELLTGKTRLPQATAT
jgi:type I restriction enzyme S subunit